MHIYEFSYTFDTVLYQFLETGASYRFFICIVYYRRAIGHFVRGWGQEKCVLYTQTIKKLTILTG